MQPSTAAAPFGSVPAPVGPAASGPNIAGTAGSGAVGVGAPAPEAGLLEAALFEVKKVIVGQERVIERLFVCLLAEGHCLLEGVPGLAKTLAMETLARAVGGTFNRLQFTPDLLPADIVGTRIYRHSTEAFDVELGPVFANFVLADEVNRAPAKVQSALLEVMAERHVSIAGTTFPAPDPFLVLATQNPIESEGVYALPEAQRDRFLMKVLVGYPTRAEEVEIVHRIGAGMPTVRQVLSPADLIRLQQAARDVYVDPSVVDYAVNLVLATRQPGAFGLAELDPLIDYGASPRASLGLVAAGRALALLRGRRYALPQDVFDVAPEVLRHRLVLSYEALAQGLIVDQLTARVLSTVPAPRVTPMLEGADYTAPLAHLRPQATTRPGSSLPTMPTGRGADTETHVASADRHWAGQAPASPTGPTRPGSPGEDRREAAGGASDPGDQPPAWSAPPSPSGRVGTPPPANPAGPPTPGGPRTPGGSPTPPGASPPPPAGGSPTPAGSSSPAGSPPPPASPSPSGPAGPQAPAGPRSPSGPLVPPPPPAKPSPWAPPGTSGSDER